MATTKDYYKVLGVDEKAKAEDIKKAYRKLARENHPDRNQDDPKAEDRFKEIQEAHETLSDQTKRREYDASRRNPFGEGPGFATNTGAEFYQRPDGTYVRFERGGRGAGRSRASDDDPLGGFGDIFGRVFNQSATGGARAKSGRDIEAEVQLSFLQSLEGGKREVSLPSGETVRITIPKGVRNGFRVRLKGRGQQGIGGRGDLFVTFSVEPDPRYRREGKNILMIETISAFEAILGTQHSLTTVYGKQIKLTIPPGTQPADKLRVRGHGVETDKGTGDLFVQIEVKIPTDLTEAQRKVLREAAEKVGLG